ncbi:hypothetical protein FC15_GL000040 [Lapidilactobacillus concavus DSM 17758]|uniref:Lipopolysaccharide assembly protein A domain-containing protein n=1 Tax=Lapidilactobacillus concavus DSM 17758 TaxID=1423735 RepID=A0A0R1W7Q3_9LACO|nr:lipopolysaccharide assembly protein LapA domain-containing protein [Lapidilactobacillus concavus]KRM13936.1 hypothetical protein FC15_GL000040 [Lapidilactobacillus concavus DSM 17758]GEL13083.1 hypothetical protein LCO01nite_06320 [Lapidilactobacillus concavus]
MKNQGRFILGLLLALVVVIFAVLNVESVSINFGFAKVAMPLVLILLLSLVIGALIAFLLATGSNLSLKKQNKRLNLEVTQLKNDQQAAIEQQVAEFKAADQEHIAAQSKTIAELQAQLKELSDQKTDLASDHSQTQA